MTLYLAIGAIILGLAEGIPLVKEKQWKELLVLCLLLGAAFFLGLLNKLGLPNPIYLLKQILEPIGKIVFK